MRVTRGDIKGLVSIGGLVCLWCLVLVNGGHLLANDYSRTVNNFPISKYEFEGLFSEGTENLAIDLVAVEVGPSVAPLLSDCIFCDTKRSYLRQTKRQISLAVQNGPKRFESFVGDVRHLRLLPKKIDFVVLRNFPWFPINPQFFESADIFRSVLPHENKTIQTIEEVLEGVLLSLKPNGRIYIFRDNSPEDEFQKNIEFDFKIHLETAAKLGFKISPINPTKIGQGEKSIVGFKLSSTDDCQTSIAKINSKKSERRSAFFLALKRFLHK